MSSIFFEIKKDHFVQSELIEAFFKETVTIAAFPKVHNEFKNYIKNNGDGAKLQEIHFVFEEGV